jgi:hypothetical protein
MEKEEKKRDWQKNGYLSQEDLSNGEYGFMSNFFISERINEPIEKKSINERDEVNRKKEFKNNDQSATFFLPDFFTHDE